MEKHYSGHSDLLAAQNYAYEPNGLFCKKIVQEAESQEYGACTFEMNDKRVVFRVAKITPTKVGQFVSLWKRIGSGPILPFDYADLVDLFVVSVRSDKEFGQFVFPKTVLLEKGFVSKNSLGGKRAMRVYSPWDRTESLQVQKTQAWQLRYFFAINPIERIDTIRIKQLFRF